MSFNKSEQIQTFIFMDFEVAGKLLETEFAGDLQPRNAAKLDNTEYLKRLLASDVDLNRVPRITEMSYIFIPRALFIEAAENMHQKLLKNESEERDGPIRMELTMDICTNQINPDLNEEDWALYESKQASIRLRRSELSEKNRFEEVWPAIHHLLKVKPKPACLIAHNGLQFDFRILMHELERTDMLTEYPIPEGVVFLDSYLTFLDIEAANHRTIQQTLNAIDWNLLPIPQQNNSNSPKAEDERGEEQIMKKVEKVNKPDKNGEEEKDVNVMDEDDDDGIIWVGADCPLAQHCPPSPTCSNSSSIVVTDKEEESQEKNVKENNGKVQQKIGKNEAKNVEEDDEILCIGQKRGIVNRGKMPMKGIGGCANVRKRRRLSPEELDPRHPFRFLRRSEWCPAKRRRIPADLFELDKESGQWHFSEHASTRLLSNSGNFKLPIIFRSIIGGDFRAHRAQADSEALLQVSLAYGMDFIELADKNCAKFPVE